MVQSYLRIARRWIWLLVLTTLVTSFVVYTIVRQQSQQYLASARVIVGPGLESPNPDLDELRTAGLLMQTYAELITTRPVLQDVISSLDLPHTPEQLRESINLRSDETTRILTLQVQDEDPARAVDIANQIADALVRMGPMGAEESEEQVRVQTRNQIGYVEEDIAVLESTIRQLQEAFEATNNPEERRIYADQLALKRAQLAEASKNVVALYESLQQSRTNRVRIIEASVAAKPVDSDLELTVVMAGLAGLILSLGVVLALEYMDDSIREEADLTVLTGIPLLGRIHKHRPLRGSGRESLVVQAMPESRTAENYRVLASKLLLARYPTHSSGSASYSDAGRDRDAGGQSDRPLRSLLISGTHMSSQSSEIAANLAVILAQTGHRVILVDAYLQQPLIGHLFGPAAGSSLSALLTEQSQEAQLMRVSWLPTLSVLPAGPIPANSFELLASTRMATLIEELEQQADFVLIAASPFLLFADSLFLASRVDGVVVAVHRNATRRATLMEIVESLIAHGATILGAVLDDNRLPRASRRATGSDASHRESPRPVGSPAAGRLPKLVKYQRH